MSTDQTTQSIFISDDSNDADLPKHMPSSCSIKKFFSAFNFPQNSNGNFAWEIKKSKMLVNYSSFRPIRFRLPVLSSILFPSSATLESSLIPTSGLPFTFDGLCYAVSPPFVILVISVATLPTVSRSLET